MGFLDKKATTNLQESNTQNVQTETYGQQDVSGLAIAGGGDVEVHIDQVDSGVVAAAREFGSGALSLAGDVVASALRANGDAVDSALDLGSRSLTTVSGLAGDSLRSQSQSVQYALQSSERVVDKALAATRSDAADILNNSVKYGVIAVGIIAALFVIPHFMRARA